MARDFDRPVIELQVRVSILNRFTQLGTPETVCGLTPSGVGELQPNSELCNSATMHPTHHRFGVC